MVSRAVPTANDEPAADALAEYPDSLDAGLLRIAGVCILASVMAILDGTVVSVAQRTFIAEFASTQAVVAWTITGYTLGPATLSSPGRLGIRPIRHQAAVHGCCFVVHLGVAAVLDGIKHHPAHRISSNSRLWRRDAGAVDPDHLDARGRPETARQVDGGARYPDAACPDVRAGPRWLADQRLRLAMDLPDQPADRRDPAGAR